MAFNTLISKKHHYEQDTNLIITLRCIHGRQPQKLKVMPSIHRATGQPLGIETLTEEEKKTRAYVPTITSFRTITDGTQFNLADSIDRIDWNWVQYCEFIAPSLDESLYDNSPVAYYVENLEADLKAELAKSNNAFEAESWVRQIGSADLVDKARLLGQDMSLHAPGEVLVYLLDVARRTPQRIQELREDRFKDERLFLYRLLDKGIVRKNSVGIFYYENTKLGTDEIQVLNWLTSARNSDIVELLWDKLFPGLQRGTRLAIPSAEEEVDDAALHPVKLATGSQHLSMPKITDPMEKLRFDAQRMVEQYDARVAAGRITQDELDEEKRTGNIHKLRMIAQMPAGPADYASQPKGEFRFSPEAGQHLDSSDSSDSSDNEFDGDLDEDSDDEPSGFDEGNGLLVGPDNEPFPSAEAGHASSGNVIRPAKKGRSATK